jgi:hypothetical protein
VNDTKVGACEVNVFIKTLNEETNVHWCFNLIGKGLRLPPRERRQDQNKRARGSNYEAGKQSVHRPFPFYS